MGQLARMQTLLLSFILLIFNHYSTANNNQSFDIGQGPTRIWPYLCPANACSKFLGNLFRVAVDISILIEGRCRFNVNLVTAKFCFVG